MPLIPYLSQGRGVPLDPRTGLPTSRKQPFRGSFTGSLGSLPPGQSFGGGYGGGQTPYGPINLPASTHDYKSLIQQALGPLSAQLTAEGSADVAGRNAGLIRGLTQFGEQFDPSGAQAAFGEDFYKQAGLADLLPQANQLAAQNTQAGFSVSARQRSAFDRSVQQIQDALAARGMLRSGATGIALQGAQKEYDAGQYDARQQLADYFSSVQQGYVAGQRARQSQLDEAQRSEAGRQAQLNPPTGSVQAQPAGVDPVTGQPFYRKPDGTLVDGQGNPYTPAAATQADAQTVAPPVAPPAASSLQDIIAALHRASQGQRLGF